MTLERNKDLVRRLVDEVVNARDLSALDHIAAEPIARAASQMAGWPALARSWRTT